MEANRNAPYARHSSSSEVSTSMKSKCEKQRQQQQTTPGNLFWIAGRCLLKDEVYLSAVFFSASIQNS